MCLLNLSTIKRACTYMYMYNVQTSMYEYIQWDLKGAQAWPSRVRIFLHKSDPYG